MCEPGRGRDELGWLEKRMVTSPEWLPKEPKKTRDGEIWERGGEKERTPLFLSSTDWASVAQSFFFFGRIPLLPLINWGEKTPLPLS